MRTSNANSGQSADRRAVALRQMTAEQLLDLGTCQFVYLRTGTCDGERLFMLHRADGMPLAMVGDVETAVEIAAEHALEFVTVH
ncbi:MAG TPA: DUF1150 family protein [Acetobacteraceae bacterium]|jgi:hypothetical protein|nr:DUF1150 family protein [Acetobacteraceae bacterium]